MALAAALAAASVQAPPPEAGSTEANITALVPVQATAPAPLILPKGTLVRLMLTKEINSRDNQVGQRFALRVDEDVKIDGVTIIPVGAKAWAEIVNSERTGAVGKGGRLSARLLYVEAKGQQVPIEGERAAKGGSSTGAVVASVLAFGIPGLLMKGNNASLRAGEIFNGYTINDASFSRMEAQATAQ